MILGSFFVLTVPLCLLAGGDTEYLFRWSFGLISVFLAGGIVFAIARYTPMPVQVVSSYSIAWLLLLSGVRGSWRSASSRTTGSGCAA